MICVVAARPAEVWAHASSMDGVNHELRPLIRMTHPASFSRLPTDVVPGTTIFASWLLFFGLLPFDRHRLGLRSVDDGVGFVEESSSWHHRRWRHERTIAPLDGESCAVTDRLVIEPTVPVLRPVIAAVVRRLFAHRHRRLVRRFATTAAPT